MIKIPYTKKELSEALSSLRDKDFNEAIHEEVKQKIMALLPLEKKEHNKRVAEDNGITVMELINSPNYQTLVEEYEASKMKEMVQIFMKRLDMTEVQAHAMVAIAAGVLEV